VDREIPFKTYDNLAAILREWKKRKPQSNYFFSNVRNNGKGKFKSNRGDQLAVRTVQSMISNYAKGPG
jgi:hypothetical protein